MDELFQITIAKRLEITHNIVLLEFQGTSQILPPFSAGAHIDIQIPVLLETWRSYSLTNDPIEQNRYEIAILREPQKQTSASNFLWDYAKVGTHLTIRAPQNTFPLDESANDYLFIAGGIGITPLRSMMLVLRRLQKPFSLHYATHAPEETAFFDEISSWSGSIHFHFSKRPPFQRMDVKAAMGPWKNGRLIYCCAPENLMQTVRAAATALQWPPDALCFERFSPPTLSVPKQTYPCEVVAISSKKRTFSKPGETLLATLRRMGIEVPSSCEAGTCGTCLVDLLEGTVEPHDLFLTSEEHAAGKLAISCVGIPVGPQVILEL